jgi:hypothetical protein
LSFASVRILPAQIAELAMALKAGAKVIFSEKLHSVMFDDESFCFRVSGRSQGIFPVSPDIVSVILRKFAELEETPHAVQTI